MDFCLGWYMMGNAWHQVKQIFSSFICLVEYIILEYNHIKDKYLLIRGPKDLTVTWVLNRTQRLVQKSGGGFLKSNVMSKVVPT